MNRSIGIFVIASVGIGLAAASPWIVERYGGQVFMTLIALVAIVLATLAIQYRR